MSSLAKPPTPKVPWPKGMKLTVGLVLVGVLYGLFEERIRLYRTSEVEAVSELFRESPRLAEDFFYVRRITAELNPTRTYRSSRKPRAWDVSENGGYFTFQVRGLARPKDQSENSKRYRVFFTIDSSDLLMISGIVSPPPWGD